MSDSEVNQLILKSQDGNVIVVRDKDIVGRTSVGSKVLDKYEGVSRQHAQFLGNNGAWFVVDLGSKNGTTLNGTRLETRDMVPVKQGDTIALTKTFSVNVSFDRRKDANRDIEADKADDRQELVVMFVDLKGSTDYFQEKGTMVASSWISNFYDILTSVVKDNGGEHIKNIGDAILAVFPDPIKASRAAVMMQQGTKDHNKKVEESDHYYIRIGLNLGKVLYQNKDVFGNAVNIAARIQGLAPAGQTYISQSLYEVVKDDGEFWTDFVNNEELRGVKEKMAVYELFDSAPPSATHTATFKI